MSGRPGWCLVVGMAFLLAALVIALDAGISVDEPAGEPETVYWETP